MIDPKFPLSRRQAIGLLTRNPGIHVRHADNVSFRRCRIAWGANRSDCFTPALEAHDVTGLSYLDFKSESAHPQRFAAVAVR